MANFRVLSLPREDSPDEPVLLHVTKKNPSASDLDLDVLATEGEAVFKAKVRQRNLMKLCAPHYTGTLDEWETILRYALEGEHGVDISDAQKKSLEVVCNVGGARLTVTFRNRISEITQRLGALEFKETDEEISLFDWTALAVARQKDVEEQLVNAKRKSAEEQARITSLQGQLEELVEAKKEHEDQLLAKFVVLLNEKKLRLREQKVMLASAKVDEKLLGKAKGAANGHSSRSRPTIKGKRPAEADQDNGSEEAFEDMDVDGPEVSAQGDIEDSRATTPVETDSEEEVLTPSPPVRSQQSSKKAAPVEESHVSPQRQSELPSAKRGEKSKRDGSTDTENRATFSQPVGDDEETASEDDEL